MQAEVVGGATLDLGGCARSSVFRPMLAHLPGCNFLLISLPTSEAQGSVNKS